MILLLVSKWLNYDVRIKLHVKRQAKMLKLKGIKIILFHLGHSSNYFQRNQSFYQLIGCYFSNYYKNQ